MRDGVVLDDLDEDTCMELLRSVPIGRIVFTDQALPAVQLVSFAVVDGSVLFRTSPDSDLAANAHGHVVAIQADELDYDLRTGWSVVAVGVATEITDSAERDQLRPLTPQPWAPGRREHYVRLRLASLTGRRIRCTLADPST